MYENDSVRFIRHQLHWISAHYSALCLTYFIVDLCFGHSTTGVFRAFIISSPSVIICLIFVNFSCLSSSFFGSNETFGFWFSYVCELSTLFYSSSSYDFSIFSFLRGRFAFVIVLLNLPISVVILLLISS